jgi:hypothetical protein
MGVLLGTSGMSGMHTQSLVPMRTLRPTMVCTQAVDATDGGAALSALAMSAWSPAGEWRE